jgi:uncharacterized phage protein (TIGR01671 family)
MRETIFKAWDVENKKMYSPAELWNRFIIIPDRGLFQNIKTGEIFDSDIKNKCTNHMIPMQYTGLKDKIDKEIYEGDICKTSSCKGNGHEYVLQIVKVTYEAPYFRGRSIYDNDEYCLSNAQYWEIIGNIYKNPELLK